ncbi:MAG: ATP-binding cassette domain-containing protein [Clostridia bacterium]|nr:ATP-binding cassette domain-containing protein [Clostridia bacterium]
MAYIEAKELTKTFTVRKKREKGRLLREKTEVRALDAVSFSVEKGELVGYIGPNGAGKSTTVKLLSGILTPEGGTALVDGRVPWLERRRHVERIGVVFGQRSQLWWDVPILDSFSLLRDIYRVPEAQYKRRLEQLTDALQLEPILRTPLRLLSLGQRMRAELCGSLLHSPGLLFLDEPTIGLDAVSKLALRDFLKQENEKNGTTVLLTTHDMEDIAALCSRVMVLGHGKKLFDGALPDLLARYDTVRTVTVRYDGDIRLPALPGGCSVSREGGDYHIAYAPSQTPTAQLLSVLQSAGPIRELTAQPQNIDRLIAAMYREMDL